MSYAKIRSTLIGAALTFSLFVTANGFGQQGNQTGNSAVLNPDHPETYTVQAGDTLWDISGLFLQDPWYWPEIWQVNPQVANPHLIYPGDVLALAYLEDGSPVIRLSRGGPVEAGPTERLSPRIRTESIEQAIPTIPYDSIKAFLSRSVVLEPGDMNDLPYIVAHPDGLLGSAGRDVYVSGTDAESGSTMSIVKTGDTLVDPDDDEILGYQGLYVGQGVVRRAGDPATVHLTETSREASIGDYLIAEEQLAPINYFPGAPASEIEGRIISVFDGVSVIGQYQVIVINRGARDGLEPGNVLRVFQTGRLITDPVRDNGFSTKKVQLPDEPAGITMVFRTYDRMSYALVMEATREIRLLDTVRNP